MYRGQSSPSSNDKAVPETAPTANRMPVALAQSNSGGGRPFVCSAPEIGDGEIEHLVGATAHHGLDHVERETLGHLEGDLGRDGELLSVHHGVDEHRPVMSKGGCDA